MTYRIKPLEWVQANSEGDCWAATVFCQVHVVCYDGQWKWSYCVSDYYDQDQLMCDSLEDGKAKAEAWYLDRLLPALEEVK